MPGARLSLEWLTCSDRVLARYWEAEQASDGLNKETMQKKDGQGQLSGLPTEIGLDKASPGSQEKSEVENRERSFAMPSVRETD